MNRNVVNSELDKYRKRGKGTYTYCDVGCNCNIAVNLLEENHQLKKQLEYLRSGEYLNQLKFERNMLENIVQNGEVSKEDKEFIDMTHRNTILLEENQQLKEKIIGKQSSIKALKDALKERTDERDNHYDKERLYKSVIKEIREYIKKNKLYSYKYDDEELFEITTDEVAKKDLLQILDKGDK